MSLPPLDVSTVCCWRVQYDKVYVHFEDGNDGWYWDPNDFCTMSGY